MPAPIQTSAIDNTGSGGTTRTITLTGVVAGSTLVAWLPTYRYDTAASHVSGVSSSNGGAFTLARGRIRNSQNGGGSFRLGLACYVLLNAAAGTHVITATFANSSGNTVAWFAAELPGIRSTAAVDIAVDGDIVYGSPVISLASGGNLAQAQEFAMLVFCGMGTDRWNGSTSGVPAVTAGEGWTGWAGYYTNTGSPIPGMPFAAYWRDTSTTAAIDGSVAVKTDSITDPFLMMMVTLRLAAGSFYVEVLLTPQTGVTVNGTTGWIVEMSTGDPAAGATVVPNITAQTTGNELRPPAPSGATLGQTVNVVAYNPTLAHTQGSGGTGVGTTRGTGVVKSSA